jgi:hypothetical protein
MIGLSDVARFVAITIGFGVQAGEEITGSGSNGSKAPRMIGMKG